MKLSLIPEWQRDSLRTTLWVVPSGLVVLCCLAFLATYSLDRQIFDAQGHLPFWINQGGPDAARQVLTTIAAAVITVAGVVFSVVIVALTLASQQFGPRMLRNFIRDLGTQLTLGMFVSTFVYCILVLGSVSVISGRDFVPHVSITFALGLLLADLVVLIYFIHHVAVTIQLNEVIAGIGRDLARAMDEWVAPLEGEILQGDIEALIRAQRGRGDDVPATRSGYLQAISHKKLVEISASCDAVVMLLYRPGHFMVAGRPLAVVFPAPKAPEVRRALENAHITGRHRTLTQDPIFAIDQLVEIAIRALSPAVNDTFTAMTCIDWLTAGLCRLSGLTYRARLFRDGFKTIRVVEAPLTYERIINGAFDKIRQAGRGMPSIAIRQLDSLAQLTTYVASQDERNVLRRQADMILRSSEESISEELDRNDVLARYRRVVSGVSQSVAQQEATEAVELDAAMSTDET